jgi:hypothetical protein
MMRYAIMAVVFLCGCYKPQPYKCWEHEPCMSKELMQRYDECMIHHATGDCFKGMPDQ